MKFDYRRGVFIAAAFCASLALTACNNDTGSSELPGESDEHDHDHDHGGIDSAGLDSDFYLQGGPEYTHAANEETFLILQIETIAAVENAEDIISTAGVDGVFVGPGDLGLRIERNGADFDLEEAIEKIQDMKFVSSTSRENVSAILIRFNDIGERMFDKRVSDLRREIQNVEDRLPDEVDRPIIFEVTSSNAFPSATVLVHGEANDANLRDKARSIERDLSRIKGVSRVQPTALYEPELHIRFDIDKLQASGLSPTDITDTVRLFSKDIKCSIRDCIVWKLVKVPPSHLLAIYGSLYYLSNS